MHAQADVQDARAEATVARTQAEDVLERVEKTTGYQKGHHLCGFQAEEVQQSEHRFAAAEREAPECVGGGTEDEENGDRPH